MLADQSKRKTTVRGRNVLKITVVERESILMKVVRLLIFFSYLICMSGCGAGDNTPSQQSSSQQSSSMVTYKFTATIDAYSNEYAPFPANVGDTITGTFRYDPLAIQQSAPAGVQVVIGSTTFNADLTAVNSFLSVINDDFLPLQPGETIPRKFDRFSWIIHDTNLAMQYGLVSLGVSINLFDDTGLVFDTQQLPTQLNFSDFTGGNMFFSKEVPGMGLSFGSATINSLTPVE